MVIHPGNVLLRQMNELLTGTVNMERVVLINGVMSVKKE